MTLGIRLLLLIGSLWILYFVCRKLRKSGLGVEDSIFWLTLAALLIVAAAFPGLIYWASDLLGFQSPSNFVFLCGVGILLVRLFSQDCKISALQRKLIRFAQNEALGEADGHGSASSSPQTHETVGNPRRSGEL